MDAAKKNHGFPGGFLAAEYENPFKEVLFVFVGADLPHGKLILWHEFPWMVLIIIDVGNHLFPQLFRRFSDDGFPVFVDLIHASS